MRGFNCRSFILGALVLGFVAMVSAPARAQQCANNLGARVLPEIGGQGRREDKCGCGRGIHVAAPQGRVVMDRTDGSAAGFTWDESEDTATLARGWMPYERKWLAVSDRDLASRRTTATSLGHADLFTDSRPDPPAPERRHRIPHRRTSAGSRRFDWCAGHER